MRNFILGVIVLIQGMAFQAHAEFKNTVVSDVTTAVKVKLDKDTVLCSAADYGALFLKIIIPELADITMLNHRNIGAGGPCVAAGQCRPGNMPADVMDVPRDSEVVPVRVKLTKSYSTNEQTGKCYVSMTEEVEIPIRGKVFTHQRYASLGERLIDDCR